MVKSGWIWGIGLVGAFFASVSVAGDRSLETPEFPEETEALIFATQSLFDTIEASGDRSGPSVPAIRIEPLAIPASSPAASDFDQAFPADRGPVRHLTGYRINWYPVSRFLGAVDFMGTWAGNRNLVCGYVIWDLSDPDTPRLDQLVANYVDLKELNGASVEVQQSALLDANCAYGDVDANFLAFDVDG